MRKHIIKEGQIFALLSEPWESTEIILITRKHTHLKEFWFYDYEWVGNSYSTSIIEPEHLKHWEYIGEL